MQAKNVSFAISAGTNSKDFVHFAQCILPPQTPLWPSTVKKILVNEILRMLEVTCINLFQS